MRKRVLNHYKECLWFNILFYFRLVELEDTEGITSKAIAKLLDIEVKGLYACQEEDRDCQVDLIRDSVTYTEHG